MLRTISYMGIFRRKFIWSNPRLCCSEGTKVCCLKKAIYELKQSPRMWLEKFSLTISGIGFHQCHSDHFVFLWHTKSGIVVLHDILLTDSDSAGLLETKTYLKHHFVTKDLGHPKYFLRTEVAHKRHSVLLF